MPANTGTTQVDDRTQGDTAPHLAIVDPDGRRVHMAIGTFPFDIGRAPGNALVLRDSRISRTHARIVSQNGICVLQDAGSRHGVWVNGERIQDARPLQGGERIEFGVPDGYQVQFARTAEELEPLIPRSRKSDTGRVSGGVTNPTLEKLRTVLEAVRSTESVFAMDDVLRTVVDAAIQVTGAERGFLLLFDEHRELAVRTARAKGGKDLPTEDLRVPRKLIQKALENRRELLSMSFDPTRPVDGAPGESDSGRTVVGLELRSVVCVPVLRVNVSSGANTAIATAANSSAGLIYMDSRAIGVDLAAGNKELLQTLAIEVSSILENARLVEEERGKQKIEEELAIARRIQQGLLPRSLPATGWLRIRGTSEACHEVGGDYFDAIRAARADAWSVVVADVAGKGTSSALMASFLQGVFLGASGDQDIGATLGRMNEFLAERDEFGKYATVFYAVIEPDGTMTYANAGHCAPLLERADGSIEVLSSISMPVGMVGGTTFGTERRTLAPGDKIVLYSDGVTEAQNNAGEFYGRGRLRRTMERVRAQGGADDCAALHAAIREDLGEFTGTAPQTDDVTLVVVEYRGANAA